MVYRREGLQRRLEKLKEYAYDLKETEGVSYEEYLKNKRLKYSIERLLFLMAEGILDFLDHILSARFKVVSDSYEDILANAYKRSLIGEELHGQLKGLGGFRNILAHGYLELSHEEVFRNYKKMLGLIDVVIQEFEGMI